MMLEGASEAVGLSGGGQGVVWGQEEEVVWDDGEVSEKSPEQGRSWMFAPLSFRRDGHSPRRNQTARLFLAGCSGSLR